MRQSNRGLFYLQNLLTPVMQELMHVINTREDVISKD